MPGFAPRREPPRAPKNLARSRQNRLVGVWVELPLSGLRVAIGARGCCRGLLHYCSVFAVFVSILTSESPFCYLSVYITTVASGSGAPAALSHALSTSVCARGGAVGGNSKSARLPPDPPSETRTTRSKPDAKLPLRTPAIQSGASTSLIGEPTSQRFADWPVRSVREPSQILIKKCPGLITTT